MYTYITAQSLYCTPKTNVTLDDNYTGIKKNIQEFVKW